jgi:hypothetical protein
MFEAKTSASFSPFAFDLYPFTFHLNKIWYFNKYPLIFGALFGSDTICDQFSA